MNHDAADHGCQVQDTKYTSSLSLFEHINLIPYIASHDDA